MFATAFEFQCIEYWVS